MFHALVPAPPPVGDLATLTDLLRLVAVPALGWAAWRDHRTRRVPSDLWWPLVALGVGLLLWDALTALRSPVAGRLLLVRAGVSVGLLVPLALGFHRLHLIGGADAKAFVALAVLFPTYPTYQVAELVLPIVRPTLGVLSLSAVTNGALLGVLYPVALAFANLARGDLSSAMFRAKRVRWTALPTMHGRLVETTEGRALQGLDLDAVRMYLRWRGITLEELRARPTQLRDPSSLPDTFGDPTDGAPDPGEALDPELMDDATGVDPDPFPAGDDWEYVDAWAAEEFLDAVGSAYGTRPGQLRDGLELLSAAEYVWISPGLPYLVPVFAGLLLALTYGDLLFVLLGAAGFG